MRVVGFFGKLYTTSSCISSLRSRNNFSFDSAHRQFSAMSTSPSEITNLTFDNRNLVDLPVDTSFKMGSRQVPNAIFSLVAPMKIKNPVLVAKSQSALDLLGLTPTVDDSVLAEYLSGNKLIPGAQPAAHCYCGHQFGSFAGQLGDGATMYLGEVINQKQERWELQFKGAGKTPFSRTADGRKVLRSSIREFLGSEALHHLGVPTTRSGSCISSDSTVQRDPFYDGTVLDEKCSVITRIAENFFRFGSFEIFKPLDENNDRAGPSAGNKALKKLLFDHILKYFPDLEPVVVSDEHSQKEPKTGLYVAYFHEIVRRTIALVVKWQCTGFVHGVLNTDNLSVMGLTLDYGPYGFIDHFDPEYVPNGSDGSGRYSYTNQPSVCKWNLGKLSDVLAPLVPKEVAEEVLGTYEAQYEALYRQEINKKFGFVTEGIDESHSILVSSFFRTLALTSTDFTDSFVALSEYVKEMSVGGDSSIAAISLLNKLVNRSASPRNLVEQSKRKLRIHRLSMHPSQIEYLWNALQNSPEEVAKMFGDAPVEAIRSEVSGEKRKLDILVQAAENIKKYESLPSDVKSEIDRSLWTEWVQSYRMEMEKADLSLLSSAHRVMSASNPTFILRNWIAQDVIAAAEKGDYIPTRTVLEMLETPFEEEFSSFKQQNGTCNISAATRESLRAKYCSTPPEWSDGLLCTCSS